MRDFRKTLFIIVMIMLIAVPAMAQDDDATPTQEILTPVIVDDGVVDVDVAPNDATFFSLLGDFIIEADLIQYSIFLVMIVFLGNSVPQSAIDKGRLRAEQTETPIDDLLWQILDKLNGDEAETDVPTVEIPMEKAEDGTYVMPGELMSQPAAESELTSSQT